ncbi:MAG: hypothetical protein PW786_06810 [Arachidicoccus sp.]|nr:hypothetical protein [Arachidicoccus sp.]
MAIYKKTKKQHSEIIGIPSKVYTVRFPNQPFVLTKEQFYDQVNGNSFKKKRWDYLSLDFVSYKENCLQLKADHGYWTAVLDFLISSENLRVTCNCGNQSEELCVHAFKTIDKIIDYYGEEYFADFRPDSNMEIADKYPKFFEKRNFGIQKNYTPKKILGNVYRFSSDDSDEYFKILDNLPETEPKGKNSVNTQIIYTIMYPPRSGFETPTFLLPNLAVKNNAGTDVKSFGKFLSGTDKSYEPVLSENEKMLNSYCYEIWKIAEYTNRFVLENKDNNCEKLQAMLNIWEKALPNLKRQEYVFCFPFFRKRILKAKPYLKYMKRIKVQQEIPTLHFQLTDKGAFYQLIIKVNIGAKSYVQFDSEATFFIVVEDNFYLASSIRDVGILQWMNEAKNKITIFKEHFQEFEQSCLNPLRKFYSVKQL